ncbi:MAG: hypothetical protein ACYDGR_00300 [Candidatus Dormibacteria bacterium]
MRRLLAASLLLWSAFSGAAPIAASADVSSTPTFRPCLRTLKFATALYLDADRVVPPSEVGPEVGISDPNPALCGIQSGLPVYRHLGQLSSREVVFRLPGGEDELFQSAGNPGFPAQRLIQAGVVLLALFILAYAVLPAIYGHMVRPPITVAREAEVEPQPPPTPPGS